MRDLAWRILYFVSERIRMICLALALLAAWKAFGGAVTPKEVDPQQSQPAAMAQP